MWKLTQLHYGEFDHIHRFIHNLIVDSAQIKNYAIHVSQNVDTEDESKLCTIMI